MTDLFVVNGFPQVGKDTFCEYCCAELYNKYKRIGFIFSSINKVEEAAHILGWDGVKDDKGRKFLSDLKKLSVKNYDGPTKELRKIIDQNKWHDPVIFYMVREPEEIEKLKKEFVLETILITDGNIPENLSNDSDKNVNDYTYDYVIKNNGTKEDLENEAKDFIHKVLGG